MKPRYPSRVGLGAVGALVVGGVLWWSMTRGDDVRTAPSIVTAGRPAGRSVVAIEKRRPVVLWSARDRLARIQSVEDPTARDEQLEQWVGRVPPDQICELLSQLLLGDQVGDAGRLLLRRWVGLDQRAAADWSSAILDPQIRVQAQTAVALAWSEIDLPGALAWARSITDNDGMLLALGYELAREAPAEAMELAVSLPASARRDELLLYSLRQWAAQDKDAARDWILQWQDTDERQYVLAEFAVASAEQDGAGTANFVMQQIASGPHQTRALVGVLQRWSQIDSAAATEWIQSLHKTEASDQLWAALRPQ